METANYITNGLKGSAKFSLPPAARDYLFYLETIKGRSPRTIEGYATDLKMFFRFIKIHKGLIAPELIAKKKKSIVLLDNIDITDIDINLISSVSLSDIYEFLHFVSSGRGNNANTRSRKVSSIRGFFGYLTNKSGVLKENPAKELDSPSARKSLPKYLTLEQSVELLEGLQSSQPLRDYCILTLFLNCGMRLSELVGINLTDIRDETLRLLGKGNKERIVFLNRACMTAIKKYIDGERAKLTTVKDGNALFLSSRSGERLTARWVQKIVEKALKSAGLAGMGISPHKLRHTAATLMYQHGKVDIRVLKEILGHAQLGTTEIYTHVADKNIKDAINKNPLADAKPKNNKL
ncbi:MAG: tyrosine recombinase XerC [Oscillospiraceae bacterium]|nr:tyrosine recombinase XerC [Oscillospiraceae bacterium]